MGLCFDNRVNISTVPHMKSFNIRTKSQELTSRSKKILLSLGYKLKNVDHKYKSKNVV